MEGADRTVDASAHGLASLLDVVDVVDEVPAANIGRPAAPVRHAISTLHCLTVSLAHGGAGIGTVFGEQHATHPTKE
jgi:hypothetical protein